MKDYILIAGGAGFIGTNLADRLMREGNNVLIVDNLSSGTIENIYYLEKLAGQYRVDLVFDFMDIKYWVSKFIKANITAIYNLACPASPKFYQSKPFETLDSSYLGTKNLIRVAKEFNCPMLLTSTSEVYGDPSITPQSEQYRGNTNCYGERSCYDEGKRVAETLMYEANKLSPGRYKVVRIFNTYGPHMRVDDGRFISNFICQSLQKQPLTIYGNGLQTRSICYVDDTVDGLIRMMNSEETAPVNIGNPVEMPIAEWARVIHAIIHPNIETVGVESKPLPADDPMQRCPDITRAKEVLGWIPKVSPEEGLSKTINYFKNILNINE